VLAIPNFNELIFLFQTLKFTEMKNLKRLLFFFAAICLLIACSKSDGFLGSGSLDNTLKKGQDQPIADLKYQPGTVYTLSGLSLYKTWTVKEGIVLQDTKLECTGTLEFLEKRNFIFSFQETRPDGNAATFSGTISASGELKFKFPVPLPTTEITIIDIIQGHGCIYDVSGPGVNEGTLYFNGRFDGTHFYAETKFKSMVNENCPDLFNPTYNGHVNWMWGYDLTVN
jgi:hypothetical protein